MSIVFIFISFVLTSVVIIMSAFKITIIIMRTTRKPTQRNLYF
jgi:hypothetical protein